MLVCYHLTKSKIRMMGLVDVAKKESPIIKECSTNLLNFNTATC